MGAAPPYLSPHLGGGMMPGGGMPRAVSVSPGATVPHMQRRMAQPMPGAMPPAAGPPGLPGILNRLYPGR
jgi:hypothetical protein